MSKRSLMREKDHALYLERKAIECINKSIGIFSKKLSSKSFSTINQVKVNRFNPHYNKADYYYSDLDCVTIRKK